MENLNVALVSSASPTVVFSNTGFRNPTIDISRLRRNSYFAVAFTLQSARIGATTSRISFCVRAGPRQIAQNGKVGADVFANLSSSSGQHTSSVGVNPNLTVPPPSSSIGSPLFWVGVGVGLSALFSFAASRLKQYAMQQAMKTMMNQMNTKNNQFGNAAFSPGSPFPFPTSSPSGPSPPFSPPSQPLVTVDVRATKVEAASATVVKNETEFKNETKVEEPKKYAFVDVSSDEILQKSSFENFEDSETSLSKDSQFQEVAQNGPAFKQGVGDSPGAKSTGKIKGALSVETLEKMMEDPTVQKMVDPTVQKMVYPYLPEEMRNPTTFKWMLQNPQYRQQLEEMLNNMAGSEEWDKRMTDTLKNFDLNSPEIKQQFDQIGLTPEEAISKIMANPDVAMAFQNPRVQAAIMDCSQNPLSITKYQNDKEVMDVFTKISELFPGVTGSP